MTDVFLLMFAVILMGTRLPSFLNRLGVSKKDKILFTLFAFLLLGLAWVAANMLNFAAGFIIPH